MKIKSIRSILRKSFGAICLPAVLGLGFPNIANASIDMQEGQWKTVIGIVIETPGSHFDLPRVKFMTRTCLTQHDPVPNIAQLNQKCEITNYKVTRSTVVWTSRCVDKNGITEGDGEIRYKNKNYEGWMRMTRTFSDPKVQQVTMSYTLYGNYNGKCPR